ncbi:GNAT family N-acetyltransferase [Novosphingobium umbonatum]|uniref:GNAT family N-acetyltransferase n=1 Tax=Novosphingobium umbonatum TaxID=1908524 RepID=UPI0013E2E655|nr:GNAT family N-acetyltransferase [Novosphingobium umbonatum]
MSDQAKSQQAGDDILFRAMQESDIERAVEMTRALHWPHREEDWALFLQVGQGIVAQWQGEVIGTALGFPYGDHAATLGLVIVDNAHQGKGYGRRLMQAMMDQLGERSIILQATVEGAPLYEKLGFADYGILHQHQGVLPNVPLAQLRQGERIRPLGASEQTPGHLYSSATGTDRHAMMQVLNAQDRTVVLTHDDVPVGFANLRRFGRGWSIAPVVAPDVDGAKVLILHWLAQNAGNFTRLDVTEASGLSPWLEGLGLPRVDTVRSMVRGPLPEAQGEAVLFALSAQAMG